MDLDTGEVTVRSVVAADDVGRVIHPVLAEGQVEGGTLQAVGYATIEEMKLDDGRYLNDRLATYLIPTALDAPRIETILVETPVQRRAPRREGRGRAAHGRRRAGGRRRDPRRDRRLDPRPAGDPGADPRRDGIERASSPHDAPGSRSTATVGGARGAGHAPAAGRAPRGPRPDGHQGGLRRGRVRRLLGAARRRGRGRLPGARCARSTARTCAPSRGWPDPIGVLSPLQQAFLEQAAPSAASARRGCSWRPRRTSRLAAAPTDAPSGRRSRATCAAAPATPRSSRPSPRSPAERIATA